MHARVVMLAVWSALATSVARAQQPVALRIEPPVGETVRMRLDQRVEMAGTTRMSAGDSTATVVATLVVISRTFVEHRRRFADGRHRNAPGAAGQAGEASYFP